MREIRKRSRTQTKARILQAVGDVITERGANRIGINAVAEKAGVNKVLIYRYFGGWDGLMKEFLHQGSFLSDYNQAFLATSPEGNHHNRVLYLVGLLRELKNRKAAQDMLKWEISNPGSQISQQLAASRNESLQKVIDQLFTDETGDLKSTSALVIAGLAMLHLLSPNQRHFMGVDLQSDEGWEHIERAIDRIYKTLG
ncbi:TetR/AcrR family transcriptional regulator [Larkinella bovis]|uniref:TetR/AcrR family transcriptional regulator n=1 Tax=Larkinella bovis TaxID=683041 RepID=A0ABW0I5Q8_9BACT